MNVCVSPAYSCTSTSFPPTQPPERSRKHGNLSHANDASTFRWSLESWVGCTSPFSKSMLRQLRNRACSNRQKNEANTLLTGCRGVVLDPLLGCWPPKSLQHPKARKASHAPKPRAEHKKKGVQLFVDQRETFSPGIFGESSCVEINLQPAL